MSKKSTFSTLAVTKMQAYDPAIKTRGFAQALRDILELEDPDADDNADYNPGIIPDAYKIDHDNQCIWIYEIEDTNPLTLDKLVLITDIFWLFDWLSWNTRLIVYDRYGENPRELNLLDYSGAIAIENKEDS